MKIQRSALEKHIRKSFLNFISNTELDEILNLSQIIEVDSQQRVPREEQPQSFFLTLEGEMTLRQRGYSIEIDRRLPGQSLELKALLLHYPQWQYEWICETKCAFLKIPWQPIEAILQKYPTQLQYLARITQSVALQRLKRDLWGLNLNHSTVIELISKMRQEKFSDLRQSDSSEKMIATIYNGDLVVQLKDGDHPLHLKTLHAGDTTVIDWNQTHLTYIPQDDARVWVIGERDWQSLLSQKDFQDFLEIFLRKNHPYIKQDTNKSIVLPKLTTEVVDTPKNSLGNLKISPADLNPLHYLVWRFKRTSLLGCIEENRTGTAVLAFLLRQAGISVQHKDIDQISPDESSDTTFESFQVKASKVGVYGDFKPLGKSNFKEGVIVQLKTGFGVLYRKHKNFWTLADFTNGDYRDLTANELEAEIKNDKCFEIKKIQNVLPKQRREFGFRHLLHFLKADKSVLGFLILGSFLGFLTDLAVPVFSQYIIDQVVISGHVALLNPLVLVFLALTVIGVLVGWFNQSNNNYLTNVLSLRLKAFFQSAIFRLNPMVAHNIGASQLMTRLSDIEQLASFLVYQCFGSVLNLIFMIGNLSVLWIYSPRIVGLVLTLLPLGALITFLMKSRIESLKTAQVRGKSRENRMIFEHFSSNDDMRILKGTLPSRWKWDFNSQLLAKNIVSNQKLLAFFQVIQLVGSEGVKMVAFFFSLHLYMAGELTLGQIMAIVMLIPRVTEPLQSCVATLYQYYNNRILISRLNDLLIEGPKIPQGLNSTVAFQDSIRFENVFLGYEKASKRRVLKDINFKINMGEKIAFMGGNGAGKSSLSYLMAGLYKPDEGSVLYDDVSLGQIDPRHFYSRVALVEQEGRLFAGTILDNIALGEVQPDLDRAVHCAKAVGLDDDILSRPGGYGSQLLHGGVGLSEGQRQRLLIARALYRNPQVLILDEATSYLDPISEYQVMKSIFTWMEGRTVICFTQRVQLMTKVDRVFFIDQGQLVEQGSHRDLISKRDRYFEFYLRHLSIG